MRCKNQMYNGENHRWEWEEAYSYIACAQYQIWSTKTYHVNPSNVKWFLVYGPTETERNTKSQTSYFCLPPSQPTSPNRGWFVPPFGGNPWWVYLASALPALLVTILVFMDQQITAVIVNRKEHKLKVNRKPFLLLSSKLWLRRWKSLNC